MNGQVKLRELHPTREARHPIQILYRPLNPPLKMLSSENQQFLTNIPLKDPVTNPSYSVKSLSSLPDFYELIDYTLTPIAQGYYFEATIKNNGDPATTGTVPISWESYGYELALINGEGTVYESEIPLDLNGDGDKLDSFDVTWSPNATRPCDAIVDGIHVYALADHSENQNYNRSYYINGKSKLFQLGSHTHVLYAANNNGAFFGFGDAVIKQHPSPNLEFIWYANITASDFKINGNPVQINHTWKGAESYLSGEIYNYTAYVVPNQASEINTGEELSFSCTLVAYEAISPIVALLMNWSPDSITRYLWIPFGHNLSPPSITFPREGEIVTGDVDITWAPAGDNWGHNLLYNVYYSPNKGMTWISLATDLTTTSYLWDSTSVADGNNYMIKVNATCEKGFFTETTTEGSFTIRTFNPRGPIIINSNADLSSSFPGLGTFDDPIRIENISITSTSGTLISISGTTLYFHITDNLLNGMSSASKGIYLQNVGNGTIANNTIYRLEQGIALGSSLNNTIINNTLSKNDWTGILVTNSDNNSLIDNVGDGIVLQSSSKNTLTNNTLNNPDGHCMELQSSNDNTIFKNTVINALWSGITFVTSNRNILTNNTAHNNGNGIWVESSNNNTIINNSVSNNYNAGMNLINSEDNTLSTNIVYNSVFDTSTWTSGIILDQSSNNTLSNNTVYYHTNRGILIRIYSTNNTVINNTVYDNAGGISFWQSPNNHVIDNNLTNNGFSILTASIPVPGILEDCLQGSVINNNVNGKPFVYWESTIGGTIPSDAGQVILVNCTDITVKDLILEKTSFGIIVDFCSNITLYNITVRNNQHGIFLAHSDNNTLSKYTGFNNELNDIVLFGRCNNNILSNNTIGNNVNLGIGINWDSKNNTIANNTVFNTKEGGIRVIYSENNTISHNIISDNQKYGIIIDGSSTNTVNNNTVYENDKEGIQVVNGFNNKISNNTLYKNEGGIFLYSSSNNLIENNNVHDNANRAQIGLIDSSMNNTLVGNNVFNGDLSGIFVFYSENNTVSHNTAFNNTIAGITLYYSDNNTLVNNNASHNIGRGISIELSDETIIESNNVTDNNEGGIILYSSSNNLIENNIVYENNEDGLSLYFADNNIISNNTLNKNRKGIRVCNISENNLITDNIVFDNVNNGIYIEGFSDNNTILNNTVYNNHDYAGISIYLSEYIRIINNSVYNNTWNGIQLVQSNHSIISNNIIYNSTGHGITLCEIYDKTETALNHNNTIVNNFSFNNSMYGIKIKPTSDQNTVKFNDFSGNNLGQGFDDGSNNVFAYNYWSDWTSPDVDANGIVDAPYSIEGNSNNQDQYPLVVSPTNHYLTVPIITSPSGGETFSGDVSISWSTSVDIWGYSVTYQVSYSMDGGTTWVTVIAGLTATSFTWDIRTVPDGSNYLLTVEAISTGGLNVYSILPSPIIIDNTPPTLTIDSPLAQEYATNTITITLSGADDYWYYMEPVDTQNQTWTGDVTRTLIIDGVYTLHAYGNDSVGNIAEKTISFTIDTAPPTITIDSPAATTYTTGTITVELSSDDAVHYWYYILDIDGANLTWTSGTSRSLDDGMTYTLYAYGNDSVGNVGYASVTFTIEIPTTTPPKETTPETSIATTTTTSEGEIGSFPGHLAVLLFVTILVVVFRRHKKI